MFTDNDMIRAPLPSQFRCTERVNGNDDYHYVIDQTTNCSINDSKLSSYRKF